ncbi:MAG: hypothetical protein AB4080_10940 [Trichodesmium sp.]
MPMIQAFYDLKVFIITPKYAVSLIISWSSIEIAKNLWWPLTLSTLKGKLTGDSSFYFY